MSRAMRVGFLKCVWSQWFSTFFSCVPPEQSGPKTTEKSTATSLVDSAALNTNVNADTGKGLRMKTLMVFDFDHTVVDDNSDTWVIRCLQDQTLPDSVKSSYQKGHWTDYMGRVMSYLGEQSISPERICSVMKTIPLTDGMTELLTLIADHKADIDCIVISDSNTLFIDWILKVAGLKPAVDKVFTNPAWFKECGSMVIQKYHSHNCSNCPVNLCKKKVLEDYLSKQFSAGMEYHTIIYVGDGGNDLCPTSCLRGNDVVMPRKGYTLERLLRKQIQDNSSLLKARVFGWMSGFEILHELKSFVKLS